MKKEHYLAITWGACAVEALIATAATLLISKEPKNAFIAGFSLVRIIIVSAIFVASVILGVFSYVNLGRLKSEHNIFKIAKLETAQGWWLTAIVLILVLSVILLVITPPSFRGARIERLAPLLIWLVLCCLQIGAAILRYSMDEISKDISIINNYLRFAKTDRRLGYSLLFISLLIGLLTVYFTYFNYFDEGDTYSVGWLLSKGFILYKDIFSHHFPFSYYWVSLIAALFGHSITIYRISFLLLRIGLLAVTMELTGEMLTLGLTSIAISLIIPVYMGNILLFYSFDGIFILCSFCIVLFIFINNQRYTSRHIIFASMLIGFAILNDPLMALPAIILVFGLAWAGYQNGIKTKQKIIYTLCPIIIIGIIFLIYAGYLLISSSFTEFIQNGILFNFTFYNRYTGETYSIQRLRDVIYNTLNIFDPSIRIYNSLYYKWDDYTGLDKWIFTAFFFRLSIIFTSLTLILRKKLIGGILIFIIAALLTYRGSGTFRGIADSGDVAHRFRSMLHSQERGKAG